MGDRRVGGVAGCRHGWRRHGWSDGQMEGGREGWREGYGMEEGIWDEWMNMGWREGYGMNG